MRNVHSQGPVKADWDSSGQQRVEETFISTKKHQISLAIACSKQKVVGFVTVKL